MVRYIRLVVLWLCSSICAGAALIHAAQTESPDSPTITVGPNVRVSTDRPASSHAEMQIAADPVDSRRLAVCSMYVTADDWPKKSHTATYISRDGGQQWKQTLEVPSSGDPSCDYGPEGSLYSVALRLEPATTNVYRSSDGGQSWAPPQVLRWMDRDFLSADRSGGRFNGNVYITGNVKTDGIDGTGLEGSSFWRSRDRGSTFELIDELAIAEPAGRLNGNSVILSDGSLVWILGQVFDKKIKYPREGQPNAKIWAFRSTDAGNSFQKGRVIGDWWYTSHAVRGAGVPYLAADSGSTYFKDRLYAVWADQREGHESIMSSFSCDKGITWSEPQVINDDRRSMDNTRPIEHTMPAIAVNRDGVVGISWYDRRDFPDQSGWAVRFRASVDGGETWLPSVAVSEHPNVISTSSPFPIEINTDPTGTLPPSPAAMAGPIDGDNAASGGARVAPIRMSISASPWVMNGGDTAGIAADANGVFHPVWEDNRTGVAQVWTAAVVVHGRATRNGAPELATLADISRQVELDVHLSQAFYDQQANTVTVMAQVRNKSQGTLRGPVKVRVIALRSELAVPKIVNADNGAGGPGAVWDFTSFLPDGGLAPGESSRVRPLVFALSDLRPFRQGQEYTFRENVRFRWGLVGIDVRVLGALPR